MWRGCGPTVGRAVVLNAAQLGTYDQAKQMLLQSGIFSPSLSPFPPSLCPSPSSFFLSVSLPFPS